VKVRYRRNLSLHDLSGQSEAELPSKPTQSSCSRSVPPDSQPVADSALPHTSCSDLWAWCDLQALACQQLEAWQLEGRPGTFPELVPMSSSIMCLECSKARLASAHLSSEGERVASWVSSWPLYQHPPGPGDRIPSPAPGAWDELWQEATQHSHVCCAYSRGRPCEALRARCTELSLLAVQKALHFISMSLTVL
jgi:hypothetical protein